MPEQLMEPIKKILRAASRRGHAAIRKVFGHPVVVNANGSPKKLRRALLIYLVDPFLMGEKDPRFLEHQHFRQCRQIADALGGAGFTVDVVDVDDRRFRPSMEYDLVISHRVDLPHADRVFPRAMRVYLATGMNHRTHNRNVARRYQDLFDRRGCRVDRLLENVEAMPFVQTANAIAGYGNSSTVGTWQDVAPVPIFAFNNYGFASTRFAGDGKDTELARTRFLFFASRDQVAKGLDLLLEIFPKHHEINLYVCSAFKREKSFVQCYEAELYGTPNIHPIGLVDVNGNAFYDLMSRCAFVIQPSCSEGQPGSVVQCMHAGLIPLVTKECGLDLPGIGIVFADDSLASLEQGILEVSTRPPEWIAEQSRATRKIAEEQFSEEAFIRRWLAIAADLASHPLKEGRT